MRKLIVTIALAIALAVPCFSEPKSYDTKTTLFIIVPDDPSPLAATGKGMDLYMKALFLWYKADLAYSQEDPAHEKLIRVLKMVIDNETFNIFSIEKDLGKDDPVFKKGAKFVFRGDINEYAKGYGLNFTN